MVTGSNQEAESLAGGSVNEVVRIGDTVRRPCGPWTPAVHGLLEHLADRGFAEAPRVLGVDDEGREVLTYLPGDPPGWTDWPAVLRTGDGLAQLGALLRRYHDAVRDYAPPAGAVWRNPLAPATGEIVRHGDFSPFNTVWRDGRVTGVIDWDFAQPGRAITDLAHLAWYGVPLSADYRSLEYGFADGVDRAARLRDLCAAYGAWTPEEVVAEAVAMIRAERAQMAELAGRGMAPWTDFVADGTLPGFDAEAAWIEEHRALLLGR
ncbi:phosphotransferase enzyme family protein [Saccharothrix obliqua]|uniref:phosphotransferase enzyme family protein n=1 Tax=Saccharothrix obliqua TaxID=2861747 RepID=UPI001C5F1CF2|nr:aminoglycoside phosphotransferase family protein [Saccharothrix obliqua]MBW4720417.1 aminoglycoside phosphotransferase family protein [Saccharothrix obliqua]